MEETKKQQVHHLVSIIVMVVVVIAVSVFLWYEIVGKDSASSDVAMVTPVHTSIINALESFDFIENEAVVGKPWIVGTPATPGVVIKDEPLKRALAIANSFFSPNLTPAQANGSELAMYGVSAKGLPSESIRATNICRNPISIESAEWLKARLAENGVNASILTSESRRYVYGTPSTWAAYPIANRLGFDASGNSIAQNSRLYTSPNNYMYPGWAYCLDAGYVSNYPNFMTKFTEFANSHSNPPAFLSQLKFGVTKSDINLENRSTNNSNTNTGSSGSASSATSTYTVSVNYSKFTQESRQYGYTSVYTTTGTKNVTISLVSLNDKSSMTAAEVITKLSALGYRPATLSELYGLKVAQPSVTNSRVVALGTNLGTSYGYPTGSDKVDTLGRNKGPFNTATTRFAVVRLNQASANTNTVTQANIQTDISQTSQSYTQSGTQSTAQSTTTVQRKRSIR